MGRYKFFPEKAIALLFALTADSVAVNLFRIGIAEPKSNNNMEGTNPAGLEGTRPLRGQPYPTL